MLIEGALHVHSSLSHDGQMTVAEIAAFYHARGYHFVCMAEHSEDMDAVKLKALRHCAAAVSDEEFCMVPGLEYRVSDALHIAGIGCDVLLDTSDAVAVARAIGSHGGFAVLAHPRTIGWNCPPALAEALHAVEVWNVGYDGKFLPQPQGLVLLNRLRRGHRGLQSAAGHDFHQPGSYYSLRLRMQVKKLDRESVLAGLLLGEYEIYSKCFAFAARQEFSQWTLAQLRAMRIALDAGKQAREWWRSRRGNLHSAKRVAE
jgi:hypothetical protein